MVADLRIPLDFVFESECVLALSGKTSESFLPVDVPSPSSRRPARAGVSWLAPYTSSIIHWDLSWTTAKKGTLGQGQTWRKVRL